MPIQLSPAEIAELKLAFADLLNYESEDPCTPIDPLTYCAPDNDNCLHIAAHRGDLRNVQLLVRAGLDVNRPGDMGYTPLHYASTPEVFYFLVESGSSQLVKNEFGNIPVVPGVKR